MRLRKDRIAVALEHRVLVYNFAGVLAQGRLQALVVCNFHVCEAGCTARQHLIADQ